ncbi:hypothetical protein [Roseateles saccharophilus]|uniref:ABC-type amino acid transport substrate-binding protein n=1 Tax=Roseateles saccharophilus TaxID=304 RepID=A0A4R3V661_ROSSA|nr:hypothetical protein [Roseateles saccharophilus]MDG0834659.1 hypothetical protein [Roseateles saccharophilus]TCU98893.1 hypothetical protein EV671_1009169 [Roseateles saccharophilus]
MRGSSRRQLMLALLACSLPCATAAEPVAALRFATDANDQSGLAPGARALLSQAFERLGICVRFEPLPLRRSLRMTAQGQLDGEALRIRAVADGHPDLLVVPVPLASVEVRGYVRRGTSIAHDLAGLAPWRVGYPRGVVLLEGLLVQLPRRVEATSRHDLLRLLRAGIVDVALITAAAGEPGIDAAQLDGLVALPAPLHVAPLFALLHARQRGLLPHLAGVLQQMEDSGESARLRNEAWAGAAQPWSDAR